MQKTPRERGCGGEMFRAGWMLFQAAIAAPVYYFCAVTLKGQGLAPAIVAMGFAFGVTALLVFILDWFAARSVRKRNKASGQDSGLMGVGRLPSNGPQESDTVRVSQNVRKLT